MEKETEVGSLHYYIEIIKQCKEGCQRCSVCPVVHCVDNTHPNRVEVLSSAVLDFMQEREKYKRKIARLEELLESAMATTRSCQESVLAYRDCIKVIDASIESNTEMLNAQEDALETSDDKQCVVELAAYIEGIETARRYLGEMK